MHAANALLLKAVFGMATRIDAKSIFIYVDPLDDLRYPGPIPRKPKIILVTKKKKLEITETEKKSLGGRANAVVSIPRINLSRLALIKLAVLLAMAQGLLPAGQIICVVGLADLGTLDCIQVIDPSQESELMTVRGADKISEHIKPEIFQAVMTFVMELADKGREGKPVGTIFVVGDHEKVLQLSKQMIINPFKGYDEEERNILNPGLKETIREFAGLDGAFVISEEGFVLTAGRYLGAAVDVATLPRGLGSRHMAAAGITALTKAVAFVISQSSGDVRIFRDGKILMEIEKGLGKK